MSPLLQLKATTPVFLVALAWFGLSPGAQAVVPAPDGGYPGGNTAEGQGALFSLTTGGFNTAIGFSSLKSNTIGEFNTALGAGALLANIGDPNAGAGVQNAATGAGALLSNTTGSANTADGTFALFSNIGGAGNTAVGDFALSFNTMGNENTATGLQALAANVTGDYNTANGYFALQDNTGGNANIAIGFDALGDNTTGNFNIAVGYQAGGGHTTGDNNIYIGGGGGGFDESGAMHIGGEGFQTATYIAGIKDTAITGTGVIVNIDTGQLGVTPSSARFKEDIKPMRTASEAILALKPVTFRYRKEIDPAGTSQFGLVAENVEKVNPDLVLRDKEGKPYSVRYEAVNAMLLNEFLKEHRRVEELKGTVGQQQKQIEAITAAVQKVTAQLELSIHTPQTVLNSR